MKYVFNNIARIVAFGLLAFLFSGCQKAFVTMVSSDGGNPIITIDGQKARLPAKVCFNCNKKQAHIKVKRKMFKGGKEVQILNEDNPSYENSSVNAEFLIFGAQKANKLGIKNGDKKSKYVIIPAYSKCQ